MRTSTTSAPPAERTGLNAKQAAAEVIRTGLQAGLDAVGVAAALPFESTRGHLRERRAAGLHAGMQFTYRNPDRSTDPRRVLPSARSLVVGALGYFQQTPAAPTAGPQGRVARYAQQDHYARLRTSLEQVAALLRTQGHQAVVLADDNALVDREAARRAGLGYYGKNSCILLPGQGSWFVLGSVVTSAALTPSQPVQQDCGSCRRCMDACPTGAIVAPGVVDARRCLAWLLQAEGDFPTEYRAALGDRIYGCDDCSEVCPPNRTHAAAHETHNTPPSSQTEAWVDLVELLEMDDATILARHGRWYIPRRDPRYVRRNALVALGNVGSGTNRRVRSVVQRYQQGADPMLRRHAAWAAQRLGLPHPADTC